MHSIHPFTDFLKLSVPLGEAPFLRDALEGVIVECGASEARPGLFRLGDRGTVKFGEWGKVGTVGFSGDALAELRLGGLFLPALSVISECPHRITQADVALDVACDAPPVLRKLYRVGRRGELQLTRKRVPASQVKRIGRFAHVDGGETGTVYFGARTAAVCARVYDKRNEILDRAISLHGSDPSVIALNDPGPMVRYEITFGRKVGITLRDVADPTPLFWHFGSGLLPRPAGVPEWEPHAEGFELPRHEPNHYRQLDLLLQSSGDVKRAARLAHKMHGTDPAEILKALRSYLVHGRGPVLGHPVRA